jgi:RNase P protein component
LIRRRKFFHKKYFGFFYYDKYPNLKFNQISINIQLKYSKRAVQRVAFKRQLVSYIQVNKLIDKKINGKFYKIFVTLNKKNISELKSQLEKFDKRGVNNYILNEFKSSFFRFSKKI